MIEQDKNYTTAEEPEEKKMSTSKNHKSSSVRIKPKANQKPVDQENTLSDADSVSSESEPLDQETDALSSDTKHYSEKNSDAGSAPYPNLDKEIESFLEKSLEELTAIGKALGVDNSEHKNKVDLVFLIIEKQMENQPWDFFTGVLEIMESGYGFLRKTALNYKKSADDIYVAPSSIKQYNLRKGDVVSGFLKVQKDPIQGQGAQVQNNQNNGNHKSNSRNNSNNKFRALSQVISINYILLKHFKGPRKIFDNLVPIYPQEMFQLEYDSEVISTRILSLFSPIGKGQRSLIVAPPRTGKTILLQQIANAIIHNHPSIYLIVLLIDERPEEVTDMERSVRGEVISSTFDEEPDKHCRVAEITLEKAKRLVELNYDVVILMDNITRLARAYNQDIPASGKVLSGGVDAKALLGPKKFFGAARNIENGGSLTIISTALIETGSRMDEVIFEEFKGTGNMEVNLDRSLAERRLYPAIDIFKSGTRKEELLIPPEDLEAIWHLREKFGTNKSDSYAIMKLLVDKMKMFKTNKAFLKSILM